MQQINDNLKIENQKKSDDKNKEEEKFNPNPETNISNNAEPETITESKIEINKSNTNNSNNNNNSNTNNTNLNKNEKVENKDNPIYLCPNGYTLSNDKKECYIVSELIKKYKCKEGYVLNNDNTCTGIGRTDAKKIYTCDQQNDFYGWEDGANEAQCYRDGWYLSFAFTGEKHTCTDHKYHVVNGSWDGCYNEKYSPTNFYYHCSGDNVDSYADEPQYCYKKETIPAMEYYECDNGYKLNTTKDSCIKTINSTKKQ